jgi:alpha/beta superfamily hydrolase
LIDEVGYDDAARAAVARLLGTESLAFYSYSFGGGLASLLQVRAPEIKLPLDPSARFLYLWKP